VCSSFVQKVRRLVLADSQQATSNLLEMEGARASWFPAHWKSLSVAECEARWCCSGVIARVAHGRQALEFLLEAPSDAELQ